MSKLGYAWLTFLLVVVALGIYGVVSIKFIGIEESPIPWGILIATYVFLALTSTGLGVISVIGNVYKLREYKIIAERASFLAIITILCAYIPLLTHLGHVGRMYNFILTPNFYSSMWWMSIFYAFYILFETAEFWFLIRYNIVKLSLESSGLKRKIYRILSLGSKDTSESSLKRDAKYARILGFIALISAVSAHFTLGTIFARLEAKALWHGAFMPFYFIISAVATGIATILMATIVSYWLAKIEMKKEVKDLFTGSLRRLFIFLITFSIIFYIWQASQSVLHRETYYFINLLVKGHFAKNFWLFQILGKVLPLIILIHPKLGRSLGGLFFASITFLVGSFVLRYEWIVVGQSLPLMALREGLIEYTPSTPEILVVSGTFALLALIYTIGIKLLPLEKWYVLTKAVE